MSAIEFYHCEKCGNVVALLVKGDGTLECCDEPMVKLEGNTTDAAQEKHVPVVTKEGGKIHVAVGSVLHPMLPEHFIEWIALEAEGKVEIKFLKPGEQPKAEFPEVKSGTVYEFCNLHGLWKANFQSLHLTQFFCLEIPSLNVGATLAVALRIVQE